MSLIEMFDPTGEIRAPTPALSIFVPFLGRTLNNYLTGQRKGSKVAGWMFYRGDKKTMGKAVEAALVGIRRQPFPWPVAIVVHPCLGPKRRKLDCTNYVGALKMLEDSLVEAGMLVDDTAEYVKGVAIAEPTKGHDPEGFRVNIYKAGGDLLGQMGLPLEDPPPF